MHPDQLDLALPVTDAPEKRGAVVVARVAVAARKVIAAKPAVTQQPGKRVDWFKVITQICRAGHSANAIADAICVARTTLLGWKQGAEPRYGEGERLVMFWCHVTGQGRDDLPMVGTGDWWSYHSK